MVEIRNVKSNEKKTIDTVASIHIETFSGFFLSFMGHGFLNQMYRSYCEGKESGLLVAEEENQIVGFLAYSGDLSGLYKYMIQKRFIPFAWYSMGAFFRKPTTFLRIFRAFLKPKESKRPEQYMELASIGVKPDFKSNGVGSLLIDRLKDTTDFLKYEYITLETDAIDNDGAIHFYEKNGFYKERMYVTNEGRKMYEYRFRRTI